MRHWTLSKSLLWLFYVSFVVLLPHFVVVLCLFIVVLCVCDWFTSLCGCLAYLCGSVMSLCGSVMSLRGCFGLLVVIVSVSLWSFYVSVVVWCPFLVVLCIFVM